MSEGLSPVFKKIKTLVLGKGYDLSFSFVTQSHMRAAMKYKKERTKKTSNVLAFPLTKTSGEILICKSAAKPYTPEYLFIHGCLHLKGLRHGVTMENKENQILEKFGFRRIHKQAWRRSSPAST